MTIVSRGTLAVLSAKQLRFVEEYLVDLNAKQAAIRAGYSENGASVQGSRLLANANIAAEIASRRAVLAEKTGITQAKVLEEYGKLAFSNMQDYMTVTEDGTAYVDLSSLTREQAAAIQELTSDTYDEPDPEADNETDRRVVKKTKIKLTDKKTALDSIARHLGMFVEKVEVSVTGNLAERLEQARMRAKGQKR